MVTSSDRSDHGIVAGERGGERRRLQWVARDDGQPLGGRELARRADKRGDVVAAAEREVHDMVPGMAGGTEYNDTHAL